MDDKLRYIPKITSFVFIFFIGRTRQLPLQFQRAFPVCPTCRKAIMYSEYSDSQLYTQIQYVLHLFDIRKAQAKLNQDELTFVRCVRSLRN